MRNIGSKLQMRQELLKHLETLEKLTYQKTFLKSSFTTPQTRLGVIIATATIKIIGQTEELLAAILEKKFFSSLAILRMIFEEVILITFLLSKLEKAKTLEQANHVLLRISTGTASYAGRDGDIPKPYNIHATLEEAEKYLSSVDESLKGIFEETYSFISDYVHPNAPSHFYFMRNYGVSKRIISPPTTEKDMKMLLNYACMAVGLFIFSIQKLLAFDFDRLLEKS